MNEKQLNKVQKCLELAKSGNANEAANALAMAQKLMRKYGLSDEDIQFIEMGETTCRSSIQQKPVEYVARLISKIAKTFGVVPMLITIGGKASPQFLGHKAKAMTAAYAFDVIYRQLKIARRDYIQTLHHRLLKKNKTVRADAFCEGWVFAVVSNLIEEVISSEDRETIERYKNRDKSFVIGTAKSVRRKGGSIDDYAEGHKLGGQVAIHTPVNGTETMKLGVSA
ncbi:DUF7168 domain-containing protein [Photobacterium toruni]|uniref:Uncharacterized protein n=1 Tax=Photobacterium toruni TaxID=1935446 RepID=A0A1T4UJ84_9GAMM|nr:DUF2786 domain-containing protein [Photobacterium toruni]SKA52734.1 hypothetical protein CZ814_03337 [Photobacterium toruni]